MTPFVALNDASPVAALLGPGEHAASSGEGAVRLTKYGHSCVRLSSAGATLVIDPGSLSEPESVHGADGVLVTHEHFDHFSESRLRYACAINPSLEIWTVPSVAESLADLGPRVHTVMQGESFTAAGFAVEPLVTLHAPIHAQVADVLNAGFLVEGAVFHPGDALTLPSVPVDTLLVPVHGSWTCLSATIEWVRAIRPRSAVAIHDAGLSSVGNSIVDGLLGSNGPGTGAAYLHLASQESVYVSLPVLRGVAEAAAP